MTECDSTTEMSLDADPRPVQIVKVNLETREFELDEKALSSILLHEKARDKPVAVVSIAGDFRKGKSFMLNFFLRYLRSNASDDWLSDYDEPLKGFSWRAGSERDTTGILMWSEPFTLRLPNGQEIAVLMMDTQGAFDDEHTVKDSATVFALSTMLSSIQVYNILHNLQEDNLQILQIFTEYGRLALENSNETPFQKLLFLIRDWSFPFEYPFGLAGGSSFLDKKLMIKDTQPPQLQRVRRHIRSCFKDIECFLMPYPGTKVATNPSFDGRLSEIESEFVEHLRVYVPLLLSPESIILKEIGGQQLTGIQLMEYFKVYLNIFKGETMPEPKSMLEATAEANNLAALASAKELYIKEMEEMCGGAKPFVNPKVLENKHCVIRDRAVECFHKAPKMGGISFSEPFIKQLEEQLIETFEQYKAHNKSKNMFTILGSPVVLFIWFAICLIISKIFDTIGITPLANLFFFFGMSSLALTIAYMIFKYQGTFPEFVTGMDACCEIIWSFLMNQAVRVMQNAIQHQTGLNISQFNQTKNATGTATSRQKVVQTQLPKKDHKRN